ncbi:MAG TPA: GNAT family N-acetyltransferase [Devosia sp.]|nr:GNAT family N-acetyltransferase [Devosia sp.]
MSLIAEGPARAVLRPAPASVALRGVRSTDLQLVSPQIWDETVARFDGVCQEQLYAFARTRWPGVSQEPVLFWQDGELVGGSLMMIQRLPLGLSKIAIAKWGPMLARADRQDALAAYSGMIGALVDEYAKRRGMMLSILPRASLTDGNPEYTSLIERGFRKGTVLGFPNRYIVNLRLSDEEQRRSLHQKWRYHLNKSERAGLTFEHAGAERRPEFDALYEAMTDRKKFADHSAYETVPALFEMDEALRPELFFVRHEGEVVAGAIIFKAGDRAVYLYGATNEKALPLRAGYFMHWHIIRWLRDHTVAKWYDLGGTDGFQGLHQFKKGMVGDRGMIAPVPPVANYASRALPFVLGTAAFNARDLLHKLERWVDSRRPDRAHPDQKRPGAKDE